MVPERRRCAGCCRGVLLMGGAVVVVVSSWVVHVTLTCLHGCGPPETKPGPYVMYFPDRQWRQGDGHKLILLWTHKFGDPTWGIPSDYSFNGCPVNQCRVTSDPDKLNESDALLFHSRAVWNYFLGSSLPPRHEAHQVWILHDYEPPAHVFMDLEAYSNVFNWTMTYRKDSDIVSPYGRMVRRDNTSVTWETETDPELRAAGETRRDSTRLARESQAVKHNYRREKTKLAAWTASNCISQGRRRRLLNELGKHLQFDSYGDCGNKSLKCTGLKCADELGSYRFYLAFENALCKDYVTEKLWNSLARGQIPVVYGEPDYSKLIPRNSYIDVRDFDSVKELTDYIKKVDGDEELYNSYMWWRGHYSTETYPHYWCLLCEALHDHTRPAQVYTDLDGWYKNDTCQGFSLKDLVSRFVEGYLLHYRLIH